MPRSKLSSSRVIVGLALWGFVASGCTGDGASQRPGGSGSNVPPDDSSGYNAEPPFHPDLPVDTSGLEELACRPDIVIAPNSRAMIVTDPEVLARFSLERVLQQLISQSGMQATTPLELIQGLFDTQNSDATGVFPDVIHCDDPENMAFRIAPAMFCPRAEGKLATSTGFFEEGHPDYFVPVALVNRFDLAPRFGHQCGEHRIVYAKWSGRTNPNERVFLIFEGILGGSLTFDAVTGCRPVAEAWASLADESDVQVIADRLEDFYFAGLPGFPPVLIPQHFSLSHHANAQDGGGYGEKTGDHVRRGQVRLSQGMQEPWEFREFHMQFSFEGEGRPPLFFAPVTTKNNPRPELFDSSSSVVDGVPFREHFQEELPTLANKESFKVQFSPLVPEWNSGASMISSESSVDFVSRAFSGESGQAFWSQIQAAMLEQQIGVDCPPDDPLLPEHLVQRVSMLSCAGCHAPEQYLGPSRAMGCGQTWPSVPQRAHIDEFGKLSPALTDTFLPRRADVMSMYLQACDIDAIRENLEPAEAGFGGLD